MSSALEAFRAQREEAEQIHARLTQVVELLHAIRSEANVLAHDEALRKLLQEEQTWLARTKDLISEVRHFRETEASRFWPAMWRRWVVAAVFALAAAAAFGAGHVWASRPYEAELCESAIPRRGAGCSRGADSDDDAGGAKAVRRLDENPSSKR